MRILFIALITLFLYTSAQAIEVAVSNNNLALQNVMGTLTKKIDDLTLKLENIATCLSQKQFVNLNDSCLDVLHVRNEPPTCSAGQSISWDGTTWSCLTGAPTPGSTPTPATGSTTPTPTCTIASATCTNPPRYYPYRICEKNNYNSTSCTATCVYAYPTQNLSCP